MLKVWMTPTPSEAAREPTNSIHNIVMRLDKYLPDYGVQLVENPDNAQLLAAHAGQGANRAVDVAHYHGLYPTAQGSDNYLINAHVIRNLRAAKIITAPSQWIADVIRRDMHVNPRVIGWGVDVNEWQPGSDPHVYVLWNKARVDVTSDPQPMLELAAKANNALFLTTFGQGTPNVKAIGRQTYEDMKRYIQNAYIYLATVTETFGIGTLEAMASGVPVLGFRHGNTAHLVEHGVTGFLAEPGDIDGLYAGLDYCMRYRDRLGANAREAAKQWSWERVAEQFAQVYHDALKPRTGAKVTVVIPCHNYAQYVGEALESVLKQETNFDYQVIVVLDRCTDHSYDVVHEYRMRWLDKAYPACSSLWYEQVDYGNLSATRNHGIKVGSGEYLVCLDADDRIGSPKFLQTLSDTLDTDRTLGIAFTGIRVMDANGTLGHHNPWPKGYDFDLQAQRKNQVPSCCMFRREAWERAGGFRPYFVYAQDAEFWLTVGSLGYRAQFIDTDWFQYRLHNQSQSQVHRNGTVPEPDWTEFHPWTKDGQRPFASDGRPPRGSWPVRFYLNPKVSIIIPVGPGHEETVKDALHSVEGQTERIWECIVVDDANKRLDLTGFPWARHIVTNKHHRGAGAARNQGAAIAEAPFLVFLDADDMLKPHFLEKTLAAYTQHGKYVYTDWLTHDKQTNWQVHPTPEYSLEAYRNSASIHPITALIPRAWFETVGGFDETLDALEDVDLYLKFLTHGFCGVRVPEPLMIYNLESGTRRKQGESQREQYHALIKERYSAFMESNTMCSCVEPPKGLKPMPPTSPEIVSQYQEAYGDTVKIELVWDAAPLGLAVFRGPDTNVNYGRRKRGDIFLVWAKDFENHPEMFRKVEDFTTPPPVTVVPEPPPVVAFETVTPVIEVESITGQDTIDELIDESVPEVVEVVKAYKPVIEEPEIPQESRNIPVSRSSKRRERPAKK